MLTCQLKFLLKKSGVTVAEFRIGLTELFSNLKKKKAVNTFLVLYIFFTE